MVIPPPWTNDSLEKAPANSVADLTQYINKIEAAHKSAYAVYAKHTGP